jgi:hypothetical protein
MEIPFAAISEEPCSRLYGGKEYIPIQKLSLIPDACIHVLVSTGYLNCNNNNHNNIGQP